MIRKKLFGLSVIASLAVVSCNKKESHDAKVKPEPAVVSSPVYQATGSVKKQIPKEYNENREAPEAKNQEAAVSKNSVEGTFVASTCDGGRFSIELKNSDGKPTFKILDKGKIIAAGNVSTETDERTGKVTEIAMGEIGGLYHDDKIIIQNYGNAMNEFDHFTQCDDKYLEFTKSR